MFRRNENQHQWSIYVILALLLALLLFSTSCSAESFLDSPDSALSDIVEQESVEPITEDELSEIDETYQEELTELPSVDEPEVIEEEPETIPENSSLEVHFIDVGQADSILIICDGKAMMVDGGNAEDSSLIYTYLKNRGITTLEYIVCSHPHEDHVGGLSGALNYVTAKKAFCPLTYYDSKAFSSFVKYLNNQGLSISVPSEGDTFQLGSAKLTVLASGYSTSDANNSSIVLRLDYGIISFLFAGDAGEDVEKHILNSGAVVKSDVLKVGHHGSNKSTCYQWLREVAPEYAVISVGSGNSYGHPTDDTLSKLRDADVSVYRTDMQGTIVFTTDGFNLNVDCQKNKDADTLASVGPNSTQSVTPVIVAPVIDNTESTKATNDSGQTYWVNTNTGKFHYPSCASAKKIKDTNLWIYDGTRDDLISRGYVPCKNCNP